MRLKKSKLPMLRLWNFLMVTMIGFLAFNSYAQITSVKQGNSDIVKIHFLGSSNDFVAASLDGTLARWNPKRNQEAWKLDLDRLETGKQTISHIYDMAVSPDSQLIAISFDQSQTENGRLLRERKEGILLVDALNGGVLQPVTDFKGNVAFSPDGELLAISDASGSLTLWSMRSRRIERTLQIGQSGTLIFLDTGRVLIATRLSWKAGEPMIKVYETASGHPVTAFPKEYAQILGIDTSQTNEVAISGYSGAADGIKIWSLSGKLKVVLPKSKDFGRNLVFSSDGKLVISSGERKGTPTIGVHATDKPALVKTFRVPSPIRSLALSDDKRLLLAGDANGGIVLLNVL